MSHSLLLFAIRGRGGKSLRDAACAGVSADDRVQTMRSNLKTKLMKKTIAMTIAIAGTALAAPAAKAQCHTGATCDMPPNCPMNHAKTGTQAAAVVDGLDGYTAVADALYKDDLKAAKQAAAELTKEGGDKSLIAAAEQVSASDSLAAARKHFQDLSKVAIRLTGGTGGWQVVRCSMAFDGAGGTWLQKAGSKEIRNPYMGTKMPHCGVRG